MQSLSTLRSALPLLLFTILAGSTAWACFGDRGVLRNQVLLAEVEAREVRLADRRATIGHLRSEIERMRSDPLVQERWIREELGYVKPGEVVYYFPDARNADFELVGDRHLLPAIHPKGASQ